MNLRRIITLIYKIKPYLILQKQKEVAIVVTPYFWKVDASYLN